MSGPIGPVGPPGSVGPAGPPGPLGIPVPVAVTVDCSAGQTITDVLQTVSGSPLTITVSGTCDENVTITRNDVTLQGVAAGSGITGPDTTLDTIVIQGAQRVILDSLTVSGGHNGVNGKGSAAFTVQHSTIQNTGNNGIIVLTNSRATIDSNTVTGSGADGITVRATSNGTITNTTVQSSTMYGVHILEGSSARIGFTDSGTAAGNLIQGNGAAGIQVIHGSSAWLYGNTVQNNGSLGGYEGIDIERDSAVRLIGLNTIDANTGPGINLIASSLFAGKGDTNITPNTNDISNNSGGGIYADLNSSGDLRNGVTITNNQYNPAWTGYGLYLRQGSQLRLQDTGTTVSGNAQGGIFLLMGSTAQFRPGSTVSGNTGYDLQCQNGAGSSYLVRSGATAPVSIGPGCTSF